MQEYWSGLPFPTPGDLPNPGIEPESLASPASAGGFFFFDDDPGGGAAEEPGARHRVSPGVWSPHRLGPGPTAPESYLRCHPQLPRGVPEPAPAEPAPRRPVQPQAGGLG